MAVLTAAGRRALPKSDFAIPGRFPIPDKGHAKAALEDVSFAKGLKPGQASTIRRKAEAKLHGSVFDAPPHEQHAYAAGPQGAKPARAKAIHDGEKAKLFGRMGGY